MLSEDTSSTTSFKSVRLLVVSAGIVVPATGPTDANIVDLSDAVELIIS